MGLWGQAIAALAALAVGQGPPKRSRALRQEGAWGGWLSDPKNAVLVALASVLLFGGGRKLIQARRARAAIDRLHDPSITPIEVEAVVEHQRACLVDLFRLLGTAPEARVREAAGRALAILWAQDHLIPEEEQAVVRRGFAVTWRARKRFPRGLRGPIPIAVSYGVPFLREEGLGVHPANLEWSQRVTGAERAGLETFSPWIAGAGRVSIALEPGDFPSNGPHRLVLQTRVRTRGLTSPWEIELPHMQFQFEFDPSLAVDALLTLADETRGQSITRSITLDQPAPGEKGARFLDVNDKLVLRDPPVISVRTPLPSDLAHRISLEFDGLEGSYEAGEMLLSGQGGQKDEPAGTSTFRLGQIQGLPPGAIDHPGERSVRAILTADPDRGWTDPDIRSIWPGTVTTNWVTVRLIRR